MKTFWDRGQNGGKKHFSYTELETSFFLPRTGSSVLVPYLNGIQKDLEIRDSKAENVFRYTNHSFKFNMVIW